MKIQHIKIYRGTVGHKGKFIVLNVSIKNKKGLK